MPGSLNGNSCVVELLIRGTGFAEAGMVLGIMIICMLEFLGSMREVMVGMLKGRMFELMGRRGYVK